MGWTRRRTRRSWSSTLAAVLSTSRSWKSARALIEVKSTNGDTHLGGDDWDERIVDWMIDEFKKDQGIDLRRTAGVQRLREAAEKAKIELSTMMETDVNLPYITADATGPKHLQMTPHALEVRAA